MTILSIQIETTSLFFMLLIIVMTIFCLYFYSKNKKLEQKISKLEKDYQEVLENRVIKKDNEDLVSIQKLSTEKKKEQGNKNLNKLPRESKTTLKPKLEYVPTMSKTSAKEQNIAQEKASFSPKIPNIPNHPKKTAPKPYQKNLLQTNNKVTSPVSISKKQPQEAFDIDKLSFDLNEFIKKSNKIVPPIKEQEQKTDYLKELSDQMAKELNANTIELTEYEKEQEEHAIISYQELLAMKDKIMDLDDEEETIDFIEELKKLRSSLK